jgi:hypothetical protein
MENIQQASPNEYSGELFRDSICKKPENKTPTIAQAPKDTLTFQQRRKTIRRIEAPRSKEKEQ